MILKFVIVFAYVVVMLAIGFACMRRNKTISDFFLAGRSLGPWMSWATPDGSGGDSGHTCFG
jgi:SSS family solute:Na+ symporter